VRESSLTSSLILALERLMPGCVVLKHFDSVTTGIPDLSITWAGRTVWMEIKWAHPTYEMRADQMETVRRLGMAGIAYYVIFESNPKMIIIRQSNLDEDHDYGIPGHNYGMVAAFIRERILAA